MDSNTWAFVFVVVLAFALGFGFGALYGYVTYGEDQEPKP